MIKVQLMFVYKICHFFAHLIFRLKEESTFNTDSSAVIKLNNGTVMYLRQVTKYLALVCILREDSFKRQGK